LNTTATAFKGLSAVLGAAGALGAGGVGTAGSAAGALGTLFEFYYSNSGDEQQYVMQVNSSKRIEFVSTTEYSYDSDPKLGAGDGDVIVYLRDATFVQYRLNSDMVLVPIGYKGLAPEPVPASALRVGASNPPLLSDQVRASLLALDPVAGIGANPKGNPSRFAYVGEIAYAYSNAWTISIKYEEQSELTKDRPWLTFDREGKMTWIVYGNSDSALSQRSSKATLHITGPANFSVYYDRLFGTFAFADPSQGSLPTRLAATIGGTLMMGTNAPLRRQVVAIRQGNNKVYSITDDQGHYAVTSASLEAGQAEVLTSSPSNDARRILVNLRGGFVKVPTDVQTIVPRSHP
jgi:hypothetical protein